MSDESSLYASLHARFVYFGRLDRVENRLGSGVGMPDLHYLLRRNPRARGVGGWLELKWEPRWPVRPETPVELTKLTLDQVMWHEDYHRLGGRVFTLAQIGTSYVLFDAPVLRRVWEGQLTRRMLLGQALVSGQRSLPGPEVLKCLTA
jgi:hypothetical protein